MVRILFRLTSSFLHTFKMDRSTKPVIECFKKDKSLFEMLCVSTLIPALYSSIQIILIDILVHELLRI